MPPEPAKLWRKHKKDPRTTSYSILGRGGAMEGHNYCTGHDTFHYNAHLSPSVTHQGKRSTASSWFKRELTVRRVAGAAREIAPENWFQSQGRRCWLSSHVPESSCTFCVFVLLYSSTIGRSGHCSTHAKGACKEGDKLATCVPLPFQLSLVGRRD